MLDKEMLLCLCLIIVNFNSDQLVKSLQQNSRLENAADEQNRKLQDSAIKPLKQIYTMISEMVGLEETSPFDHSNMNSRMDNPDSLPTPSQFMKDSRSDQLNMHPPSNHPNMPPFDQ